MAVKKEIKKEPIKYTRNDNKEEETLNALVKERDEALGKAKVEEEDKAETESLAPEEKTFKRGMVTYVDTPKKRKNISR